MKIITIAILLLLATAAQARTWTQDEVTAEYLFGALVITDLERTKQSLLLRKAKETNPILGSRPTNAEINRYAVMSIATHAYLVDRHPGNSWLQWASISAQHTVITRRKSLIYYMGF